METILGFVAGYLAGCRDGQDGVRRLRGSVEAIRNSPEARRMAAGAMMFAGAAVRQAIAGRGISGLAGTIENVTDRLANRAAQDRAA